MMGIAAEVRARRLAWIGRRPPRFYALRGERKTKPLSTFWRDLNGLDRKWISRPREHLPNRGDDVAN